MATKEVRAVLEQAFAPKERIEKEKAAASLAAATQAKAKAKRDAKAAAEKERKAAADAKAAAYAEARAEAESKDKEQREAEAAMAALDAAKLEAHELEVERLRVVKAQREAKLVHAQAALQAASQKAAEGQKRVQLARQAENDSKHLTDLWRGRRARTAVGGSARSLE